MRAAVIWPLDPSRHQHNPTWNQMRRPEQDPADSTTGLGSISPRGIDEHGRTECSFHMA